MVESSEGGIDIATTVCEISDAHIADGLRAAAFAVGMTARIDTRDTTGRLRVTLEHAADDYSRAANLVRIYQRADAAHEEWGVLDLIVQKPSEAT